MGYLAEQEEAAYIPGDTMSVEISQFVHEMHLKEVRATFTEEVPNHVVRGGSDPSTIELKGEPAETPRYADDSDPDRIKMSSRVVLSKEISRRTKPGIYKCTRLVARTYTGQVIPFDPRTEEHWKAWRFRVKSEPDTPPHF
jgi:hypothetical protein